MIDWSVAKMAAIPIASVHTEDGITDWSSVGRIYEHLACFYLSSVGFKAEIKDAAGYDILCECPDGRFFKVEVKSTTGKVLNACSSRGQRSTPVYRFSGMRNKAGSDVFMFFDRKTNYMALRLSEEMGDLKDKFELSHTEFSEYFTNHHLQRLISFSPPEDASYIFPTNGELLKLNRGFVRSNIDLVHEMKSIGVWQSTLSKFFGIGDKEWIRRICREDRSTQ